MSVNPFLAETLLRTERPSFGLGVEVAREERAEAEAVAERRRQAETRGRKFETARGVGRTAGGILGFLVGGPAGAGVGSAAGQKLATLASPGANKKLTRVSPGRFFVSEGTEREKQFRFAEDERTRMNNEQILASAILDTFTGARVQGAGGPSGILDTLLGRSSTGVPGSVVPTTGGSPVPQLFPRIGGIS